MSVDNGGCHHKNAIPRHDYGDNNGWPVCRMACPCGLRGKGWVYHIDDESGKANAETEARRWWVKNTSRSTPHGTISVPEDDLHRMWEAMANAVIAWDKWDTDCASMPPPKWIQAMQALEDLVAIRLAHQKLGLDMGDLADDHDTGGYRQ